MSDELLVCKKCGHEPYKSFCDNFDLHVTVHAVIECGCCDNCSETFVLPDDQSIACKRMGELIEQLAIEHWNLINKVG